jgi:putative CocE/NonD family hydrolase
MKYLICLLFTMGVLEACGQDSAWIRDHYYKIERSIPMRDGIRLFTAIYIPKDSTKRHPILLNRTPYSCAPYGEENFWPWWDWYQKVYFKEGYIMVMQDVRGRWMSEGVFEDVRPWKKEKKSNADIDESTDAYDAIDWLVKNVPGNNGKLGVSGISYPGFYSTEAAICGHPALKAVSPQAPVTDWFAGDDAHHNGALFLEDMFGFFVGWGFGAPHPEPTTKDAKGFWISNPDPYQYYLDMGPLRNLTKIALRDSIKFWMELTEHPDDDAWWKERDARNGLYNVKPAMLEVGGLFDAEDYYGTLQTYKAIERQSPHTNNSIVLGPWFHGQWFVDEGAHLGHIRFGSKTSEWYQQEIELPFFNFYLNGEGNIDSIAKATIFFTGENQWKRLDQWPPRGVQYTKLYLRENNGLDSIGPALAESYDSYTSDPSKPVPYSDGVPAERTREYMTDDQRFAATRPDVLVFKTDSLTKDMTLAGQVTVDLKVSISTTDADFVVKLIDVFPDNFTYPGPPYPGQQDYVMGGYQMLVRGDVMRGRYRNSLSRPEPFVPGKITEVRYSLNDIAHTFKKGHRIMVQVQSSWFPLVDRNPQQFVDIYTCPETDFKKSDIKVYHDAANASSVILPVY